MEPTHSPSLTVGLVDASYQRKEAPTNRDHLFRTEYVPGNSWYFINLV